MRKKIGLTLVESVVIISITTLSLSVAIPSSNHASRRAKKVLCINNLKRAGRAWGMYLDDHDGYFPTGWNGDRETSTFWNHPTSGIYPYLHKAQDDLMCPEVRGTMFEVESGQLHPTGIPLPWAAWGVWNQNAGAFAPNVFKGDYGSYGINY